MGKKANNREKIKKKRLQEHPFRKKSFNLKELCMYTHVYIIHIYIYTCVCVCGIISLLMSIHKCI